MMKIEKLATKGKEKDNKGMASCTVGIELMNNIRGFWYCFGIHIHILSRFLSELAVVIYNEYHIYIPTNKPIYDIKQYKFQSITCTFYTMIIY